MGTSFVRFKAEVDFDGRELTRYYLENQDLDKMLMVGMHLGTTFRLRSSSSLLSIVFDDDGEQRRRSVVGRYAPWYHLQTKVLDNILHDMCAFGKKLAVVKNQLLYVIPGYVYNTQEEIRMQFSLVERSVRRRTMWAGHLVQMEERGY